MLDRQHEPRIYYFCYRHQQRTGGQKHTYRHVDILNKHGYWAAVFHPGSEYRLDWFDNRTKVISEAIYRSTFRTDLDILVLPEDMGSNIGQFPGRKVIFNKNVFHGFNIFGRQQAAEYPYHRSDVIAAFVVSEHNGKALSFAFPDIDVEQVPIEVDPSVFRFAEAKEKKRRIVCATKNIRLVTSIIQVIHARERSGHNCASHFEWLFLENYTESQTASLLREAALLLFCSEEEGMGRLPIEAMASGCLVVSLDVGPLAESLPAYCRFPPGDVIGPVRFIEEVMKNFPLIDSKWASRLQEGRRRASHFSPEAQEATVVGAWRRILERAQRERK